MEHSPPLLVSSKGTNKERLKEYHRACSPPESKVKNLNYSLHHTLQKKGVGKKALFFQAVENTAFCCHKSVHIAVQYAPRVPHIESKCADSQSHLGELRAVCDWMVSCDIIRTIQPFVVFFLPAGLTGTTLMCTNSTTQAQR